MYHPRKSFLILLIQYNLDSPYKNIVFSSIFSVKEIFCKLNSNSLFNLHIQNSRLSTVNYFLSVALQF